MPHSWKHSRSGWTGLWATWSGWRCPCLLQGGWTRWPLKVPMNPNYSMLVWFYFHVKSKAGADLLPPEFATEDWPTSSSRNQETCLFSILAAKETLSEADKSYVWYTAFTANLKHTLSQSSVLTLHTPNTTGCEDFSSGNMRPDPKHLKKQFLSY